MRLKVLALAACVALATSAAEKDQEFSYKPDFGGVLRARWELSVEDGYAGQNRFELRNARVWLKGRVLPKVEYFLQADLCDMGKMKFLDGWARFYLPKGFNIRAGQYRIPFGVDAFRGPGAYIFANRSFIGRDVANNRALGVECAYKPETHLPFTVTAGVFSNSAITDHSTWSNKMTVAAKAAIAPGPFSIAVGAQTISPDSVRMNMADAAVTYRVGRFTAEAEYMYTHYTGRAFDDCHAYNIWADYGIPLPKTMFRRLGFQGRFEGCSAQSTGRRNADGCLVANTPSRRRITLGSSLSYHHRRLSCELQLNYEKYLYHDGYQPEISKADKVVAELIIVF